MTRRTQNTRPGLMARATFAVVAAATGVVGIAGISGVGAGTADAATVAVDSKYKWSRSACNDMRDNALAGRGFKAESTKYDYRWETRKVLKASKCDWGNLELNGKNKGTGYRFVAIVRG